MWSKERGAEGGADAQEPDEKDALVQPDDKHEPESPALQQGGIAALEQGGIGADAVKKPSGSTDVSCHQKERERKRESRDRAIEEREREREEREEVSKRRHLGQPTSPVREREGERGRETRVG